MTTTQVQVGMVGVGLAARANIRGYATHPAAQVVAVCDLDRARAQHFAAQHGIPEVYTSYEEMLARAPIDTVDIGTPTHLHASMALAAATAGKHIHCEKPFCRSVGEGLAACAAAAAHDVKLVVGETYVFLSSHMRAREMIEAGEIGRPLQIRQRHGAWLERATPASGPSEGYDRGWRLDPHQSGGGDYPWIFDHAVHFFATAEYLMPGQQIEQVYAPAARSHAAGSRRGAAHDPYTTAEVDIPIITWQYAGGESQGVWMRAERLNGKYDYMRGFSTAVMGETGMIEVLGEGGHNLLWEGRQQHLVLHREGMESRCFRFDEGGDAVWDSDISYYGQGHIHQVHHLIECILHGRQPRYGCEEGVHAVRCTLAAIASARAGRPVRIDEIGPECTAYAA